MGIFKGVGYPEDIGRFYKLEEYEGYIWTSRSFSYEFCRMVGRRTSIWNIRLVSYTQWRNFFLWNKQKIFRTFWILCTLSTDTEVLSYLFDLLARKHQLSFEIVAKILAAPFWEDIERLPENEQQFYIALRTIYASALVNGLFAVIVANSKTMVGLNDRIKLRPLVAASKMILFT